ncbi:hypothetical protein PTKIN_Ptkin08bG0146200 [Pterospermum kingtungense]
MIILAIRPLIIDFDVLNMVATIQRNHNIHVYLVSKELDGEVNTDNGKGSLIDVGSDSEVENEASAVPGDETMDKSDIEQDYEGYFDGLADLFPNDGREQVSTDGREQASTNDYDMEDDDNDHHYEVHVDLEIPDDLGMGFASKEVLKDANRQYARINIFNLKMVRNDRKKVKAVCQPNCPWALWRAKLNPKDTANPTWQIKTFVPKHYCMKDMKNKNVTSRFIHVHFLHKFMADPRYSVTSLQQDVLKEFGDHCFWNKCILAKQLALEIVKAGGKKQDMTKPKYKVNPKCPKGITETQAKLLATTLRWMADGSSQVIQSQQGSMSGVTGLASSQNPTASQQHDGTQFKSNFMDKGK